MNTQYDVDEWAARTTLGRRVFNHGYGLSGSEFRGWKLLKVVTIPHGRDVAQKAYIWEAVADPKHEMVRVDITERQNWRLAQESLREQLMECMRPDIPSGTKALAQLGDVVFAGREPRADIAGAIFFSRGNLCVTVSNVGEKEVDVSRMATRLDRELSEPPAPRAVARGEVRARTPRVATVMANEAHILIADLRKATPPGGWLKIIVPDGELNRKGHALVYVSPSGGKKQVGIFSISRK